MRFQVTPELGLTLKALRSQSGIASKELADRVGRSPSYISKLENADVKTVEKDLLTAIFGTLCPQEDFYGSVLPTVQRLLAAVDDGADGHGLVSQSWFVHYDVIERRVTLEPAMAQEIRRLMDEAGLSSQGLADLVNGNLDTELSAESPANQLIPIERGGVSSLLLRVHIVPEAVEAIRMGKASEVAYYQLNALVFALFRTLNYPGLETKMPPEEAIVVLRCMAAFFDKWNVHTLTGFAHYMASDEFARRQVEAIGNSQDVVVCVADQLRALLQVDTVDAVRQLCQFSASLAWDPAFALRVAGIPFTDLGDMSFLKKRELLGRIEELLQEYVDLPEAEKRIEKY